MPSKIKSKRAGRPRLAKSTRRVFIGTNVSPESALAFREFAKGYKSLGVAMDALIQLIK